MDKNIRLRALRKIKEGNLQTRVEGKLSDEFLELATAFTLKDQFLYMQQAERLAVVGELAAGLAHEVKKPDRHQGIYRGSCQ
ncbi:MAG: hypothetical protein V1706_10895 [Pseudomonadota bacterium]